MNVVVNVIVQILAILTALGAEITSFVPEKWKPLAVGIGSIVAAVAGIIAHYYNPNGTSAKEAYRPESNS
ncbi:hypothetical protein [Bacteriophage sp.]|nr:hypothetical protein [Bacteriophage sp.]